MNFVMRPKVVPPVCRRMKSLFYDLLREGFQFPALGLNVLCTEDGAYKGHAVHAGAPELQDIILVDAADGHHRHIHGIADVDEGLPGQDVDVLLGVGSNCLLYTSDAADD